MSQSQSFSRTRTLVECALLIAIGIVLGKITLFSMPYGGSVTLLLGAPLCADFLPARDQVGAPFRLCQRPDRDHHRFFRPAFRDYPRFYRGYPARLPVSVYGAGDWPTCLRSRLTTGSSASGSGQSSLPSCGLCAASFRAGCSGAATSRNTSGRSACPLGLTASFITLPT